MFVSLLVMRPDSTSVWNSSTFVVLSPLFRRILPLQFALQALQAQSVQRVQACYSRQFIDPLKPAFAYFLD